MKRFRIAILFFALIVPGVFCFSVCMFFALQDWALLQKTHAEFARVAQSPAPLRAVFVAEARQNIHRINLFADVVWALLGAIIFSIGVHGLCASEPENKN